MENEVDCVSILSLPSELLFMILKYNNDCEIMNFAQTCKHFYAVINSNQFMWKQKSKDLLPCDTYNLAEIYRDDSWCRIFKSFYWVQKQVYSELIAMSSKYFSRIDNLTLEDVWIFFSIGLSDKLNYYYVIHVLQELIRETHRAADNYHCTVPRTLTEAHYARSVVRFLMQTFLTVKWVEKYLKNVLYPEVVLNFFIQWLDPLRFHPDDEVDDTIKGLVDQVNAFLPKRNTSEPMTVQDKIDSGLVTEMHVLYAIKQVVYKQRGLSVVNKATLDTLDVVQVVRSGVGCAISLAAIVHGVARRCGVRCELLAFPHHLILQWQHAGEGSGVSYKIMLNNGELVPKGKCPFSDELGPSTYKYCAGSFLQYATASFLMSKGLPKDSYSQSSTNLLDFLSSTQSKDSPYWSFLPYLFDDVHARALTGHRADLRVIQAPHKELIGALIRLGPRAATICRDYDVQRRTGGVRYAVGMICNHRKYDYLCVIREWSPSYPEKQGFPECKNLRAGTQQPFYNVVAVDQTHRLVAQEDIVHHAAPQRLVHLEDMIAKEFSHFDGFCYVPNSEKEREYPEDGPVRELYRARRAPR